MYFKIKLLQEIIALFCIYPLYLINCDAQSVSINSNKALPNEQAIFDVNSPNKGVLIPRVNLADTANPIGGAKPIGLLVWNDNPSFDKGRGFYFWAATRWHPVVMIYKAGNGITIDSATNTISSLGVVLNSVNTDGIVPAPTSTNRHAKYETDFKGNPAWKKENKTIYFIEKF
jgi:hypothetical protein